MGGMLGLRLFCWGRFFRWWGIGGVLKWFMLRVMFFFSIVVGWGVRGLVVGVRRIYFSLLVLDGSS